MQSASVLQEPGAVGAGLSVVTRASLETPVVVLVPELEAVACRAEGGGTFSSPFLGDDS